MFTILGVKGTVFYFLVAKFVLVEGFCFGALID